jgi:hypothetical protein
MTSRRKSKNSLESVATTFSHKKRKMTLVILIITMSISTAIEIGFIAIHTQGYSSPTLDSYKHALCTAKILDLSQKGVIRDTGGALMEGYTNVCI